MLQTSDRANHHAARPAVVGEVVYRSAAGLSR